MSSLLAVEGLSKRFGAAACCSTSTRLQIDAGSAYVLTGANGAGKSTCCGCCAAWSRPRWPALVFMGQPLRLSPYPRPMREAIAYVHQHPVMFSTSVADNIAYGLLARGRRARRSARRVRGGHGVGWHRAPARQPPATLSGGEKQRVALARARCCGPGCCCSMSPPPTSTARRAKQVIALIPTLVHAGSSVVMACHDRDLIGLPGVRRLKLRDGRMEIKGA